MDREYERLVPEEKSAYRLKEVSEYLKVANLLLLSAQFNTTKNEEEILDIMSENQKNVERINELLEL